MPFYAPDWVPELPSIPDSVSIDKFILDENYGRYPLGYSKSPFTCGLTGQAYSALDLKERVDFLARALSRELGFQPNQGTEWDKVIGLFSINTIDTLTLAWATHRLSGIQTPANAAYSASEMEHQLRDSKAKCLFTCLPLLDTALKAAKTVGLPKERIYLIEVPEVLAPGQKTEGYKTLNQFISEGAKLPRLEELKWSKGDGEKKTAFLCYSSGTSGLPKGVMISHKNVISNVLQMNTFEDPWRQTLMEPGNQSPYIENCLGLLPLSHIYALIVVAHLSIYRGDGVIVLPKFEFKNFLETIQRSRISTLYLVPPIIIMLTKSGDIVKNYDLSSVKCIFTGAAPLGEETAEELQKMFPSWSIRQAYGMTESATVACSTIPGDVYFGSSGNLMPGMEARIVTPEGKDVTAYDSPGELWLKGPNITLGYLNNEKATAETFIDGFLRTGDEAVIRKHPKSGTEHIFVVDRLKELIKVKGMQVAPAELEAHLLTHPSVNDCVVIGVPSDREGEVPKAFVVKSPSVGLEESDRMLAREIAKHVEEHKAKHKWLKGGIEFIDVVPKSPSGKILRRLLRDQDKEKRRKQGAKL